MDLPVVQHCRASGDRSMAAYLASQGRPLPDFMAAVAAE
jgi:hypothetical protein